MGVQHYTTLSGPVLLTMVLLASGYSCISGTGLDAKNTADKCGSVFDQHKKVKQVLIQTWEKIQLEEGREISCSKSLNGMVFGAKTADVIYEYVVLEHNLAGGESRTLIHAIEKCAIASDELRELLSPYIDRNDSNGRNDIVMISYMDEKTRSIATGIDAFEEGLRSYNEESSFSVRCTVHFLWSEIKKRVRPGIVAGQTDKPVRP
jgi:hypothetical protein